MSTLKDIDRALRQLNDALCSYERNVGSGHTLLLIPHLSTLPVRVSLDGKPVDLKPLVPGMQGHPLELFLQNALREREDDARLRSPEPTSMGVQEERRRRRD